MRACKLVSTSPPVHPHTKVTKVLATSSKPHTGMRHTYEVVSSLQTVEGLTRGKLHHRRGPDTVNCGLFMNEYGLTSSHSDC